MDSFSDERRIASALRWWEEAGVDVLVEDIAEPWLARVSAPIAPSGQAESSTAAAPMPAAVPAPAAAPAPRTLPENLADFVTWMMADSSVPEAGPPALRLRPFGAPGAPLLIVTDMPELGDADSGQLMSGAVGQLFEAMLAAMGQDRQSVYCLPLCPGRPPTGRLPNSALKDLGDLARHHIALAEPKAVWLLGQATSRALIEADSTATLDKIGQNINHFRGKVPCIASLHPRLLLQAPQRKASVWKDMQVLIGGLT